MWLKGGLNKSAVPPCTCCLWATAGHSFQVTAWMLQLLFMPSSWMVPPGQTQPELSRLTQGSVRLIFTTDCSSQHWNNLLVGSEEEEQLLQRIMDSPKALALSHVGPLVTAFLVPMVSAAGRLGLFFSTFQLHGHLSLLHGASLAKQIFLLILISKNINSYWVICTGSVLIIWPLVSIDNSKVNFCSDSMLISARNKQEHEIHTMSYKLLNQRPKTIKTGSCTRGIDASGAVIVPCKNAALCTSHRQRGAWLACICPVV